MQPHALPAVGAQTLFVIGSERGRGLQQWALFGWSRAGPFTPQRSALPELGTVGVGTLRDRDDSRGARQESGGFQVPPLHGVTELFSLCQAGRGSAGPGRRSGMGSPSFSQQPRSTQGQLFACSRGLHACIHACIYLYVCICNACMLASMCMYVVSACICAYA